MLNKPNILEGLESAEISGVSQAAGLQIIGLKWSTGNGHDYVTLDEALEKGVLDITEVDSGGQVPTLKVGNKSERMVFLMAGEELVGGKQNRVLNASMMVPANSEMPIPVTCVERGRWGYRSPHFSSGTTSSHRFLRMMMSKQVFSSYKVTARPSTDQGAVWREVSRKMGKMGTISSSDALHDLFQGYADKLNSLVASLSLPEDSNGAAFVINGELAGADLFDKPGTFSKLWPKLVRSYAVDALEDPKEKSTQVESEWIIQWLKSASSAKQHCFDSPGVGKDVRIEGEKLLGAALVVDEQPIHVELFREEDAAGLAPS